MVLDKIATYASFVLLFTPINVLPCRKNKQTNDDDNTNDNYNNYNCNNNNSLLFLFGLSFASFSFYNSRYFLPVFKQRISDLFPYCILYRQNVLTRPSWYGHSL